MKINYNWTKFYSAFADKLLSYETDRQSLLKKLQKVFNSLDMKFQKLEKDDSVIDIDPFTVFGMFNRGLSATTRKSIIHSFAEEFDIDKSIEIPTEFDGIPVLNNLKAVFFGWTRNSDDIDNLWTLFRTALRYADSADKTAIKSDFIELYDKVGGQSCIKWNITMGLFWIRPYVFVNLDSRTRWYIKEYCPEIVGGDVKSFKDVPNGETFLWLCETISSRISTGDYLFKNLPELSYTAYVESERVNQENKKVNDDENTSIDSSIFAGCTSLIEFKLPKSDTAKDLFGSSSAVKKFTLAKDALLSDGVLVGLTSCEEFVVEEGNTSFVAEGGVLYNKNKSTLIRYPQSKADTSFAVPEGVTQIGDSSTQSAFFGASNLTSVSIPASVRTIGAAAFYNCNALTNIDFLAAKDGNNFDLSIGEDAFGYSGLTSIVIPARVAAVGGLSRGTFRNNTSLTSVTFEKGSRITSIPTEAFNFCTALKSIHLPATVTEIERNAFIYCKSLAAVTIEEGGEILKIGNTAFKGTKLSVTNINALIKNVTEISEYAYQETTSTVDEDGTLVIPEGITTIGREAFRKANGIKKIQFPSSLVSIESYAFSECSNLTEVVIPDGVISIGDSAFRGCASLKKVVVPSSVVDLGNYAFISCFALEEADVACDIGYRMFDGCDKLKNLTLGNTVTAIGDYAFNGCDSLERVVLPSSLTNVGEVPAIGREAFRDCKKLESVAFAENYNQITIGESAFSGCINLSKVVFPSNLVNMDAVNKVNCAIGAYSFAGCTSLTELIGLEILEGIGDYAFSNTGLTSIYIPATLSVFGASPFLGCKLQSVELMDGNNTLMQQDGAIYDAAMTTLMLFPLGYDGDVTIPESVIALNDGVFAGSMIRSITLSAGLREVSANAFDGCVNLKKVNCEGGLVSIGKFAFRGCTSLESIEFSIALDTISSSAFQGSGLKSVTIGVNVTLIADRAFKDCVNLESVNFDKRGTKTLRVLDYAFEGCVSLTGLELPWRLRDIVEKRTFVKPTPPHFPITADVCDPCIGVAAFSGCTKLETVTIEDEYADGLVKSFTYGNKAFMGCTSLKSIEISKYVKTSSIPFIAIFYGIGESLFEGCVALKEVIFPAGCENEFRIGENAFKGCAALQSINLPATCTQLCESAFDGCIAIKTLNVPVAVTNIGKNAFNGWTAAQTIIMEGKAAAPTGYVSTWNAGCNANIVWEAAQ